MKVPVNVTVNGTPHAAEIEPRTLLVYFLRDTLGLTGTHIGCQTGQCGACTVLLDGEAVKSCMVLALQAEGREVTSIEGLAPAGTLHPVQQAFWEEHGLQCGYCTPGMVLAAHALLQENPDPDEAAVRHALEGNLCRCTGYQNVVTSVRAAAAKLAAGAEPEPVIAR
ncbi:MAG: (2Fe-2S)-binding protein [Chloroflexota bacterium]|nr:(2Fe-2S)-binding protein [Chloroflexota bacterium]